MVKKRLIAEVAERTDLTKADSERIINAWLHTMEEFLVKEGKVHLYRFGIFKVKRFMPRTTHNVHSGNFEKIPARNRVKFFPSKKLREVINGGK